MRKYAALTRFLAGSGEDRLVLSFDDIDDIIGRPLPASARRHAAFWSNSSAYAVLWADAGYRATSRGIPAGHMGFVRVPEVDGGTSVRRGPGSTDPKRTADRPAPEQPNGSRGREPNRPADHTTSDLAPLTKFLIECDVSRAILSFDEIENIIGQPLPASARRYRTFWSNTGPYSGLWTDAGYRATSRGVPAGHMGFIRSSQQSEGEDFSPRQTGKSPARRDAPVARPLETPEAVAVLLGCVKSKAAGPRPAKDLYISPMFRRRRAYAEAAGRPWFVLSALYGIVDPDVVIEPYDLTVSMMNPIERRSWAARVTEDLADRFGDLGGTVFEVHAGDAYRSAITEPLRAAGARLAAPLAGLRFGKQLQWYGRAPVSESPIEPATGAQQQNDHRFDLDIEQVRRIGQFTYEWPDEKQEFDGGWEFLAAVGSQRFRIRHATGTSDAYGRERVHTVTFVRGEPVVEGVEADDYLQSQALLSLLRLPGSQRHVRDRAQVPPGYAEFEVVYHDEEIRAAYSPQSLAVKIAEDDLRHWAVHALLRWGHRDGAAPHLQAQRPSPSTESVRTEAAQTAERLLDHGEPLEPARRDAVVAAMLKFGESLDERYADGLHLAGDAEADALLARDPFAFLIAALADQGIVAERAWRLPRELQRRLGHLDIERIASEPEAVREAVARPPALHRYVEKMPIWIVAAAQRVLQLYGGDASRIWAGEPTAKALFRRLDDFPGIGQKIAAMGVDIIERRLRVPISRLEGSDIAYDVHIRRVFLRTGLAQRDDARHMIDAARKAHPRRPGALDPPAWEIGREWCRPTDPACGSCPLGEVCPRYIDRAHGIVGA